MARSIAVLVSLALTLATSGCITINVASSRQELRETIVAGRSGPKVLLLEIDGVITEQEEAGLLGPGRESTVARVREQLDRARKDKDVSAIVLRIDTPGGSATASDIVYAEVDRFKQERGLPVVAQLMGTATSGGYYVAMAADEVVAHPTTVTGSIGVIFLGINVSGLMEKLGIENQTITGGTHKDAGSPLRALTGDERAHFQAVIDDLHARFREVVVAGRPKLDAATVEALADGSIYSANQAIDNGLVDKISSLDATLENVKAKLGAESVRVVRYHRPREWRRNVYAEPPSRDPVLRIDWSPLLGPFDEPGFHYLWWPGGR